MPGINTTGNPNTSDYNLGRGIVYFGSIDSTTGLVDASGYRDLGNAPEFTVTIDKEELEHFSSRAGLKVLDKNFVISQEVGLSFQLDELNFQNLGLFLSGNTATFDNGHDTTGTDIIITAAIVQGRWYDIYNSNSSTAKRRVYNMGATGYAFTFENGSAAAAVEGTDYVLDRKMGRIQVKLGSSILANAGTLRMDVSAAATTPKDLDQVTALSQGTIEGALKFVSENPGTLNEQAEYQFHRVQIAADGELALISDEVTTMSFTGKALVNSTIVLTAEIASRVLTIRTYTPQP